MEQRHSFLMQELTETLAVKLLGALVPVLDLPPLSCDKMGPGSRNGFAAVQRSGEACRGAAAAVLWCWDLSPSFAARADLFMSASHQAMGSVSCSAH